jgi:hypothetical protein
MGVLMVRCPKTELAIPTGRSVIQQHPRIFRQHLLSTLPGEA